MFPLFELAKLLNFSPETQKSGEPVTVRQIAWKEVGDRSFLALLISNGYLLLRYTRQGHEPIVRQLQWHPDRPIQSMTFDPTATWLLCITQKDVLYVVPALALLDLRAQVSKLWKVDDITRIRHRKRRGQPTCLAWWHSFNGDQVAVIGTRLGYVLFIDLQTEKVISEVDVSEHISNIDILCDELQTNAHALITTKSNSQWKLLLETKDLPDGTEEEEFMTVSVTIAQHPDSRAEEFSVKQFQQFSSSTFLTPITIHDKPKVAARNLHTKQLRIYDTTLERSPICAYVVPDGVDDIVVTDRILFFSSTRENSNLTVVAASLDGALPVSDQEQFNKDSVIQTFQVDSKEHILAIYKHSYPFYWHEKRERDKKGVRWSDSDELESDQNAEYVASEQTVLEGCIIVTTHNIYECRPRVSPEVLFVELVVSRSDQMAAETLASALGLDVTKLYFLAAEMQLNQHDYAKASRFLQLAKCPHLQRVGAFAQYGRMSEVVLYLRQTLDCKQQELKSDEVGQLSDLMVLAYVQQLIEDKGRTNELIFDLKEFLQSNMNYSCRQAIDTLVDNGFCNLALDMGKARNCLYEVLERLVRTGACDRSVLEESLHNLPFGKLQHVRQSSLLHYLCPADLVRMIKDQPAFVTDFMSHFDVRLGELDIETLHSITSLFDVSQPGYRKLLRAVASKQSENLMETNHKEPPYLSVVANANDDHGEDDVENQTKVVNFFAKCIIQLNGVQKQDIPLNFNTEAFVPLYTKSKPVKDNMQYRLIVRQKPLSAGHHHSALVHDRKIYLWGDCFTQFRPHESSDKSHPPMDTWRPIIHPGFQSLRVLSVSCGVHHSMAITENGVYGWGDCRHGQIGIGYVRKKPLRTPQKVEKLSDMYCVDIVCGHYHTVALMEDCSVRTWGWGIHGQLGHGSADDCHLPRHVMLPEETRISDIAAGYAHTLILTEQGLVFGAGSGVFGQLGLGTTRKYSTFTHINTLPVKVISMATKDFHCVAITDDGELYQWGASPNHLCDMVRDQRQNRLLQANTSPPPSGVINHQPYLKPSSVNTYNVVSKIVKVECGSNFSALITEDGEVFTWGRNYDGQLGIGNRNEQKTPVMVNRINDHKIAVVACGSDNMIVMDVERQVWSWGRNDMGQLAVVTSQGSSVPGGQGIYVSMGIFAAVWPTKVPSINKITSIGLHRPLPMVNDHTEQTGLWHVALPKMTPYTCDKLFILLQYLTDVCNPARWLQQCVDHELWVTAGSLALRQGTLPLALHCHLEAFKKLKTQVPVDRHQQLVQIAEFYLRHLKDIPECRLKSNLQTVQDILCQLGDVWVKDELDSTLYADLLNDHLETVAWPFFQLMTRTEAASEASSQETQPTDMSLPPALLQSLSVPFCLKVTQMVISLIQEEKIPGVDLSNFTDFSPTTLGLLPQHRMTSPDKLWEEIVRNLHKESTEAPTSITVSAHQLETLAVNSRDAIGNGENSPVKAVLFTCGHHMPKKTLLAEAVPQLEVSLADMNMPQSATLLGSQYAQKGAIPLACPRCVLNTIKTS